MSRTNLSRTAGSISPYAPERLNRPALTVTHADVLQLDVLTRESLGRVYMLESWLNSPDVLNVLPLERETVLNELFEIGTRLKVIREKFELEAKKEARDA